MCGIFYPFALQVKALRLQSKLPEKMHSYKLLLCDKFRKIKVGERRSNVMTFVLRQPGFARLRRVPS